MNVAADADERPSLPIGNAPERFPGGREGVGPRVVGPGAVPRARAPLADRRVLSGTEGAKGGALVVGPGARRAGGGVVEPPLDVEHRIEVAPLHVEPHGVGRTNAGGGRRAGGDVVDGVGDPDVVRHGRLVVDHVQQLPVVGGLHRHAIAVGRVEDRLLLTGRPERALAVVAEVELGRAGAKGLAVVAELAGQAEPDSVVQLDLLDGRDGAVGLDQVGTEAGDEAVVGRLLDGDGRDHHVVLAGTDV